MAPVVKAREFLPLTENQTPPSTPNVPLGLYSKQGARLKFSEEGHPATI